MDYKDLKRDEEIGKLNYQKMLIYNNIRQIDQQLEDLKVKVNPLKDRINLRKSKKLLETRKVELRKFQFYDQIIKDLKQDYKNQDLKREQSSVK